MILEFSLWLSTQSVLTQVLVFSIQIITLIIADILNKKQEEMEFKQFVFDYYNGTLNGGHI